jgi:hypothetical protein
MLVIGREAAMIMTRRTVYAEIGRKIRELPQEKHVSSYEWEELVQRLCASEDTGLHEIGIKELNALKSTCTQRLVRRPN